VAEPEHNQTSRKPDPCGDAEPVEEPGSTGGGVPRRAGITTWPDRAPAAAPVDIDASVPHASRMYDYLLGGTDNFAADRKAPKSRIVYVDNDPLVLAHAHTLLNTTPQGTTAYINCDLRDPDTILHRAAATLDFTQPVAVILAAILHLISDRDHPHRIVERLVEALPSGSYVAISHLSADIQPDAMAELARRLNQTARETFILRTHAQVTCFFDGLELVDPGVVPVDQWRPPKPKVTTSRGWVPSLYAALGRKP
jgi:S-adenosyl methyltransferase